MDELKVLYDIEMSRGWKKVVAISMLSDEMRRIGTLLETTSNSAQRIEALKKQKAIEYMLSLIGEDSYCEGWNDCIEEIENG